MNPRNFFVELKRRNVYKVAVAYTVVGWLLIQVATQVFPFFEIPNWSVRLIVLAIVLGFPIALIIAWAFELTPDGIKRTTEKTAAEPRPKKRYAWIFVVIGAGTLSLALFFAGRYTVPRATGSPEKSIAVLPFANLSRDPDNAYFADGIQDEVLTRLAKIADLKVISRTSTQRYKSSPENLPEIARQLGVAHILEGSVQKNGDQVRVTVQLIRAGTDSHLWAESYDRKLTDIFAVESEVAANIARALEARLTGSEQQAVAAKPTENTEAYEAYLRGLALWNSVEVSPRGNEMMVVYFERAVQLDPKFAVAWAYLSIVHSFNYAEYDRTPHHRSEAKRALEAAQGLAPDAGETQFALGLYSYRVLIDYDAALAAFAKARAEATNRVSAIEFSAYVKRRQGKWDEALQLHTESLKLDPRNPILLSESALSYRALRRFDEAEALVDRALEIERSPSIVHQKAEIRLAQGDIEGAKRLLDGLPFDPQNAGNFLGKVQLLVFARRYPEAIRILRETLATPEKLPPPALPHYRTDLGLVEALAGENETAKADLAAARAAWLQRRAEGDDGAVVSHELILIAALLRDKTAFESERILAQKFLARDAMDGPWLQRAIAIAQAQLGETDAAIAGVQRLLQSYGEGALTPAYLRLDPLWDPLRADPRFQKLSQP
ncbi:MAG: tetratricopeptide repeat protein [Chthoniobacterales bacterium]